MKKIRNKKKYIFNSYKFEKDKLIPDTFRDVKFLNKEFNLMILSLILDFDKNIYDEILSIEFLCKIRDQVKFDSIDDLKNQIQKDREKAQSLLKNYE